MKIIIAHPAKQHSLLTAAALFDADVLEWYFTTVYDKKGTIVSLAKNFLPKKERNKAERRKNNCIPDSKVINVSEVAGLISLLTNRLPVSRLFMRNVRQWASQRFNRALFRRLKKNGDCGDAIIMYDTNAFFVFHEFETQRNHPLRILDMSAVARPFAKKILKSIAQNVDDPSFSEECRYLDDASYMKRVTDELRAADYFFAASSFTKRSLLECGIAPDKIYTLPYGIDGSSIIPKENYERNDGVLRLIFAGYADYTKGLHILLEAIEGMDDVVLDIYGEFNPESRIHKKASSMSNVFNHGFVSAGELSDAYRKSDLFVFPSLIDGFGMVILEAMLHGVPVLASEHSAGPDIIEDGVDGYVVPANDVNALRQKILFVKSHKGLLEGLGRRALEKASKYSPELYEKNLIRILSEVTNGK